MKKQILKSRLLLLGIALLGVTSFILTAPYTYAAQNNSKSTTPASFANLADEVKNAVVNISTTQVVEGNPLMPFLGPGSPFGHFFGVNPKEFFGHQPQGKMKTHALGSGFIISSDGLILTNNHVVAKATEIKIKLLTGKEYNAKLVGRDSKTDLALIKVTPDKDFPKPAVLGDSDAMRVGDWVMAVGNPFGLGHTVTTGIISAKSRILGEGPYDDFLQTDAAINPGNSGGPLFNMQGQVIGINTAIIAQGQGIGFAIPINMAKELLPQLKKGKVIRGWLGLMIQDITPELAKSFGLKSTKGVLVSEVVKGSPAEKAGLLRGDIILRFDGKEIENAHKLSQLAAATAPNTQVKIDLLRNGEEKTISVELGTMPEGKLSMVSPKEQEQSNWGMSVQELTPQLAQQLGLEPGTTGVVISGVKDGSPAAAAGLHPGDLITEVNRKAVKNLNDYQQALQKVKKGDNLLLLIKRAAGSFYIVLTPSADDQ
ncbi:MAG: DegQ family serine endoprotease [Desulfobacterales bacterium]|jgi:serine protease Do